MAVRLRELRAQQAAEARIVDVGGDVESYWTAAHWLDRFAGQSHHHQTFHAILAPETSLEVVPALPDLQYLSAADRIGIDREMHHLRRHPLLYCIVLENCDLTDAGMTHFTDIPHLQDLRLIGVRITDDGLDDLSRCPQLERVELEASNVTVEGIDKLRQAAPHLSIKFWQ